MVTREPFWTTVPLAGWVRRTCVFGVVGADLSATTEVCSPSCCRVCSAWVTVWLATSGRETVGVVDPRCHQPRELPRKTTTTASATRRTARMDAYSRVRL